MKSSNKNWLLPTVTAGLAIISAVQAIAINVATSLVPQSWTWAGNPVLVWVAVVILSALAVLLGVVASKRSHAADAPGEQDEQLQIRNEIIHQSVMSLHFSLDETSGRTSKIRWATALTVQNTGERLVSIRAILPEFPKRPGPGRLVFQLIRRATSEKPYVFATALEWLEASKIVDGSERADYFLARRQIFPVSIQPGASIFLLFEHELELEVSGRVGTFRNNEEMAGILGGYLDLYDESFSQIRPKVYAIPCRVETTRCEFYRDVPILISVPGAAIYMPPKSELMRVLSERSLGDLSYSNVDLSDRSPEWPKYDFDD
jgi:hypothetical protein